MKKKRKLWLTNNVGLLKMIRMMRFTIFMMFFSLTQVLAVNSYSQQTRLTLDMKNARVEDVIDQIEKNTEFSFLYKKDIVDVERRIDVVVQEKRVNEVLDQIFEDTDISYTIRDRLILLANKRTIQGMGAVQQPITVSGKITDSSGAPLPGVTVVIKGTTQGTITDADGNYSLSDVPGNGVLVFSFVGMKTQEVLIAGKASINVTMIEESIGLEEVVAVGYGTQRKGNLTGSISSVKSEQLTIAPITNVSNALVGQMPGLVAKQTSGQPGADMPILSIRGFGAPLVIVDGVESNLNNLDASQIETISILKDGASSIYGARAGNGVILVTTKRGQNMKPTISLNTSFTMQGSTKLNPPASSGQRAEWSRESYLNEGNPPSQVPYTEEQIEKYYEGTDPNYLNSDWFDETLRSWAPQQNHNLSVRGGSDKIKYYGFLGYSDQETIVKKNGGNYSRYNVQSNVDAKITDNLKLALDMSMAYENRNFPFMGYHNGGNLWEQLYNSDPTLPFSLPDPTKLAYGGISYGSILYATNTELSGASDSKNKELRTGVTLNYDFKKIRGLKAKAFVNYIDVNGYNKSFKKQEDFYQYNVESEQYTYIRSSQDPTSISESMNSNTTLTQQYSFSYDNTIKKNHRLSVLALYENIDYKGNYFSASRSDFLSNVLDQLWAGNSATASNDGEGYESSRVSWVGRINYNYMDRFLVETIFRADASSKFPKDSRWGLFSSVSLGWRLSEEKFMKSLEFVDNLKLRASYGESGNDAIGNYQYLSGYGFDGSYKVGDQIKPGLYATGLANPVLTWEQMTIYNGGLDFSLLNRKLYGTIEGFYRMRDGIPGTRVTSLPSTFGAGLPPENLNSIDTRGFEFTIGTAGKRHNFSYDVSANISYARSKWVEFDEPEYTDPDQQRIYQRTGNWTDQQIGYVSEKLFTSQDEINNLTYAYKDLNGNSTLRPGDVKYLNLNGDKLLDWRDQKVIGKGSMPHWMYGLNTVFKYKDFDLVGLFQGAFDYTTYVFLEGAKTSLRHENRWTEKNNDPYALVARPGGAPTNHYYSDYRLHDTAYIRLKSASLGYELPENLLSKIGVSKLRVYLAGTNLFTLSTLDKYGVDPEMPDGNGPTGVPVNTVYYYPLQRTFSLGMNLTF